MFHVGDGDHIYDTEKAVSMQGWQERVTREHGGEKLLHGGLQ